MRLLILFLLVSGLAEAAWAESSGGSLYDTYKRRQAQRFDLLSYLSDQKRIRAEQNARWGYNPGGGLPFESDLTLGYSEAATDLSRSGPLGTLKTREARFQYLMNGLFAEGNSRRSLNIDLGLEGFYRESKAFEPEAGSSQTDWSSQEMGGGLLLRPFGRSSQDTGLTLKGGWMSLKSEGLWQTSASPRSVSSTYAGAEAKLYLLPFLGVRGEWARAFGGKLKDVDGRWSQDRLVYGAFLEVFVLSIEAQVIVNEARLKPTTGSETKDRVEGFGLQAQLFF